MIPMFRAWAPLAVAVAGLALVVAVGAPTAWARLTHPYDLEWMEGGMLAHAWRIRAGLPLYPPPGPAWVPYVYPPGYPALLASSGLDLGYLPARALSWIGVAGAAAALGALVGRYSPAAGVATAAMFLTLWPDTGAFYDLARPDALALGLLAAAVACGTARNPGVQITGGLLLCAAFLVKHHAAAFGPAIVAGLWLRDRSPWAALRFGLAALAPAALATVALDQATEGGFLRYVLSVPASHGSKWERAWPGTPWELGSALPVAGVGAAATAAVAFAPPQLRGAWYGGLALLGVVAAAMTLPGRSAPMWPPLDAALNALAGSLPGWHLATGVAAAGAVAPALGAAAAGTAIIALIAGCWRHREAPMLLLVGGTALIVGATMRAHVGGFVNVQMPLFTFGCVAAGLAGAWLLRAGGAGPWVAGALFVAQLAWSWARFDAVSLAPTPADREAGDRVVALLRERPGPVFSPYAPWLPVQAGHEPGPHLIAIWDVTRHPDGPWPDSGRLFRRAAAAHRWGTVVRSRDDLGYGIEQHYQLDEALPLRGAALRPRTGWRARPESLWIPRAGGGAPTEVR